MSPRNPDFRPRLFDEEGRLFRALVLALVPTCMGLSVATRAYALPPTPALDAATELARSLPRRDRLPAPIPIRVLAPPSEPSRPGTSPRPARRAAAAPSESPGERATRVLATAGDAAATLFSPESDEALDAAIATVGQDYASAADGGLRRSTSGRDVDLFTEFDDLEEVGIVVVGEGLEENAPTRRQWSLAPEQAPLGDSTEGVGAVVRAARGRVESCVQVASRQAPDLAGRVELSWQIENGRPASVRVAQNGTGDAELGRCIERAVLALDFGEGVSTRVDGYAWIVQAVQ